MSGVETVGELEVAHAGLTGAHLHYEIFSVSIMKYFQYYECNEIFSGLTGAHLALHHRLLPGAGAGAVVADQAAVLQGLPVVVYQDGVRQTAVIRLGKGTTLRRVQGTFVCSTVSSENLISGISENLSYFLPGLTCMMLP